MSRTDMTRQEIQELPSVIAPLMEELPSAVLNINQDVLAAFDEATEGFRVDDNCLEKQMVHWVVYWHFKEGARKVKKLKALLRVWGASLEKIVEWWLLGELKENGFTAEEVQSLIWALFEHSDEREEAVFTILQSC